MPSPRSSSRAFYDVAIIGGGPAGLSAGLWLGRYLHSVILIDSGDPRNWETRGVNGFLGHPRVRPAELRAMGRDECRKYGVRLVDGFVTRVQRVEEDCFRVEFDPIAVTKAVANGIGPGAPRAPEDNDPDEDTRMVRARRLLLAFGLRDEWPRVPGLRQVYGSMAHVCPDCDGYDARGKKTIVIAKGRKAAGMALNLTTWTHDIVICTNGEHPELDDELCAKLDALNIPVLVEPITCIRPVEDSVQLLEFANGMQLDCEKIFFALSQRPADDLGAQLGCQRDEGGHIVIDAHFHTSVRGVYAAGDIVPGAQLAIRAASDGAVAALAMHKSLVPPERSLSVRGRRETDGE
jgi:thioredoxin reductase